MRAILDTGFLSVKHTSAQGQFLLEMLVEMALAYSEDEFIFLSETKGHIIKGFPENVRIQYVNGRFAGLLGKKWWYRRVVPAVLKAFQPAIFVTVDNLYAEYRKLPSVLFINEINARLEKAQPEPGKRSSIRQLLRMGQASAVVTFSNHSQNLLTTASVVSPSKLHLLKPAMIGPMETLSWTDKESTKVQYALGCEYFVYAGEFSQSATLIMLLKAFSQFKKRQQSNMQLLLVGNRTTFRQDFREKLQTFRYRDEVKVISKPLPDALKSIIGSAYAFINPVHNDYLPVNLLTALSMGVPVIVSSSPVNREVAGDAAIYINYNDEAGLAKSLQDIFKDENLRTRLVDEGQKQARTGLPYNMIRECRNIFESVFKNKS